MMIFFRLLAISYSFFRVRLLIALSVIFLSPLTQSLEVGHLKDQGGQPGEYRPVPVNTPADLAHPVNIVKDPQRNEFTVNDKYGRIRLFDWPPDQSPEFLCELDNDSHSECVLEGVAYSPDGQNLYIANQLNGEILTFSRTPGARCWQPVSYSQDEQPVLPGVHSLLVTRDNRELIATSSSRQRIGVFDRSSDGRLTEAYTIRHKDFRELGAIVERVYPTELLVADYLGNQLLFLTRTRNRWELSGEVIDLSDTAKGRFEGPVSMDFYGNQLYVAANKSNAILVYLEFNGKWKLLEVLQDYVYWQEKPVSLKAPVKVLVNRVRQQLLVAVENALLLFRMSPGLPMALLAVFELNQDNLVSLAALHQPERLVTINQFSEINALQWRQLPYTEPSVESTPGGSVANTPMGSAVVLLLSVLILLAG